MSHDYQWTLIRYMPQCGSPWAVSGLLIAKYSSWSCGTNSAIAKQPLFSGVPSTHLNFVTAAPSDNFVPLLTFRRLQSIPPKRYVSYRQKFGGCIHHEPRDACS
jgi:hypothetical protein